ncbi:MAG TPA: tol-pal system protein [Anaeromyxobacter sp.]|nr:tol-pal system protein [Anaeromyxobacter sp.]
MLRIRLPLWPALALSASACWVPLERGEMMDSRLDKLEAASSEQAQRLEDQQRRIEDQEKVLKDRVAAVDKKLIEAQQKIDELNQAARRSGADLGVQVSRLQDEVNKARGDLEVAQHDLGELQHKITDLQMSTDMRFAALRGRGALDEAEAKQLVEALPRPDDKSAFMALAHQQEQKGNAGVARALYDDYVRRFPGDAAAPAAAVRSGDLSANEARWKESFVAYGWVYKNAPSSDRMPDAMLGMATAMLQLDELKADAPAMLKEIIQKYPTSPAAAKAKAKLAELSPKKGAGKKPAPQPASKPAGKSG